MALWQGKPVLTAFFVSGRTILSQPEGGKAIVFSKLELDKFAENFFTLQNLNGEALSHASLKSKLAKALSPLLPTEPPTPSSPSVEDAGTGSKRSSEKYFFHEAIHVDGIPLGWVTGDLRNQQITLILRTSRMGADSNDHQQGFSLLHIEAKTLRILLGMLRASGTFLPSDTMTGENPEFFRIVPKFISET